MAVPACYASEGRRYSRSYNHLPYYSERRYLSPHHDVAAHSSRTSIMTSERDVDGENNPPRKRIAVACLRCRKRKIRCSGDPGNGQPCNNCKNAGAEPCRFLRVSSQETPFRSDSAEFTYDIQSARAYQARGTVPPTSLGAPIASHFSPEGIPHAMASGEMLGGSYRHGAGSAAYPYPSGKGYYGTAVSAWSPHGYAEEVDYGLHLGTTPKYESGTDPAIYLGIVPAYGYHHHHGGGSPSHGGLVHRPPPPPPPPPPIAAELPPNFSLSAAADPLSPHQLHGGSPGKERILPTPARTLSSSVSYRGGGGGGGDSGAGAYQAAASSAKVSSSAHGSPPLSSIAEVTEAAAGGYGPFEGAYATASSHGSCSSSTSSVGRGAATTGGSAAGGMYSSSSGRGGGGGSDMYSTTADSLFSAADPTVLHSQGSATDLSYRYSDSHSHRDGGSASTAQLANGHVYTSLPPPPIGSVGGGGGPGGYLLGDVEDRRVSGVNAA